MEAIPSIALSRLFHHRWSVPVAAELWRKKGTRFVVLVNRLGVGRVALKKTLEALIRLGIVMRNPGYGHPLRPEYLLTARGMRLGPGCEALADRLKEMGLSEIGLRKWSMPVLREVAAGRERFSTMKESLEVTDRALTIALKDLQKAGLVTRLVMDGYPPTTSYQATAAAAPVVETLRMLGAGPPRRPEQDRRAVRRARTA